MDHSVIMSQNFNLISAFGNSVEILFTTSRHCSVGPVNRSKGSHINKPFHSLGCESEDQGSPRQRWAVNHSRWRWETTLWPFRTMQDGQSKPQLAPGATCTETSASLLVARRGNMTGLKCHALYSSSPPLPSFLPSLPFFFLPTLSITCVALVVVIMLDYDRA